MVVDNLNYDSNSGLQFFNYLLENGSQGIKHHALVNLKCLIFAGKEINWSQLTFLLNSVADPYISNLVSQIITIIFENIAANNSYNIDHLNFLTPVIEKISKDNYTIMFHLMKNESFFPLIQDFINDQTKEINLEKILENYILQMEVDMIKIFPLEDSQLDCYYLNITIPYTSSQYNHMAEFYWIKQLPFNFNIIIMENFGQNNYESLLCDCYLEYDNQDEKLMLISHIKENIIFNIHKDSLKFICNLGEKIIDQSAKINIQGSMLTFENKDFKNVKKVRIFL